MSSSREENRGVVYQVDSNWTDLHLALEGHRQVLIAVEVCSLPNPKLVQTFEERLQHNA